MLIRLFALITIVILSPLFVIISLAILIDDGFPVFFKQKRVGKDYTFFLMYKFRTMKRNTPNVATHLLEDPDMYLLKVGKILRKSSADELPNLINIVRGDMVFVGPRPALFNQDDLMEKRVKYDIHKLVPGVTGWAQINGRDEISMDQKIAYEREYRSLKSMKFDLQIFLKTFFTVFQKENIKQ